MKYHDVIIIGAGAAGMMCAAVAAAGQQVLLLEHATKLAEKIRISGGGRCNFTNIGTTWQNFVSTNPAFCRSALSAYTPQDFLLLLKKHQVTWHEKHCGQLFCDDSSEQIIRLLKNECDRAGVNWRMGCRVQEVDHDEDGRFIVQTSSGVFSASKLVVATGGMAIPQLGASDFGLKIARQFKLKIIEPRPALVPLVFDNTSWASFADLAGVSLEAVVSTGEGKQSKSFLEDVLFTHRGLSGPGILQISSYWDGQGPIRLNLCPEQDLEKSLLESKPGSKQKIITVLSGLWPKRLAQYWLQKQGLNPDVRLAEMSDKQIRALAAQIHAWSITPTATAGFKKAEVMKGGVDTAQINQKTMQAKTVPGLYFIGEVLDVTGWLGGYNFQWAWSSAVACGRDLAHTAKRIVTHPHCPV